MPARLPYALLLVAVMLAPLARRWPSLLTLVLATVAGWLGARLDLLAALSLLVMAGLAHGARGRGVLQIAALVWALLLSNYLLPGFHNLIIFDRARFSPDAAPFTMYLNFDKVAAGLLLYLFAIKRPAWPPGAARVVLATWAAAAATLMLASLASGYVRVDVKWPDGGYLWALNNLFFVCLAEEAVFRGVLQTQLEDLLGRAPAILLAALAFGLQHYQGGTPYVALASVAGLFYGYAYARTGRLEASMLVHFGVNLTHVLVFTYPSLR